MTTTASRADAPALLALVPSLHQAARVVVAGHVSPDYDSMASSLALALALRGLGKDVTVFNADGLPPNMRFLPASDSVVSELPADARYDVCVVLDSSSPDRYGPLLSPENRGRFDLVLRVDHHVAQAPFADLEYLDSERASCGELVAELIDALGVAFTREMALCIYCALVSDTGGFRYANTNAKAFACASDMLRYGVEPWDVTTRLYESRPQAELRLMGEALQTLELSYDGRLATMVVTQDMITRTQAEPYMLDGFVNIGRSIDGVEVSVLFKEQKDGRAYKLSLRSKGRLDVATLAQAFGGGGHRNAAGCTLTGSLDAIKREVVTRAGLLLPSP